MEMIGIIKFSCIKWIDESVGINIFLIVRNRIQWVHQIFNNFNKLSTSTLADDAAKATLGSGLLVGGTDGEPRALEELALSLQVAVKWPHLRCRVHTLNPPLSSATKISLAETSAGGLVDSPNEH